MEPKDQILSQVPLETLIGEKVTLQKRSGRLLGLCPFHEEKTPSFHVFQNRYYCFGCHTHGDAITWVRHFEGLGFLDALQWLAKKFGLDVILAQWESPQKNQQQRRSQLFRLALESFKTALQQHPPGMQYLMQRGFSVEAIQTYEFGFAPDTPQGLSRKLQEAGFQPEEIEQASLGNLSQGRVYDFFRNRIIIPIRDSMGRVVAFGGRALDANPAKYKNSRYDKNALLFGMDTARSHMRQKGRAIVVEGYLDALQLWQNGLEETVACQGTALSTAHMTQLSHATRMVYLIFDGDQAGQAAVWGLVEKSLEFQDLQFRVVKLPADADPDSWIREKGVAALEVLISQAEDLLSVVIQHKMQQVGANAVPALLDQEILPWIRKLQNPLQRDFLAAKLASATGMDPNLLRSQLQIPAQKTKEIPQPPTTESHGAPSTPVPNSPPLSRLEFEFLGHIYYAAPGEIHGEKAKQFTVQEWETDREVQAFCLELLDFLETGGTPQLREPGAWAHLYADTLREIFQRIRMQQDAFLCLNRENTLTKLRLLHRKNKIKASIRSLKVEAAFHEKDRDLWKGIAVTIMGLTRESEKIQSEIEGLQA